MLASNNFRGVVYALEEGRVNLFPSFQTGHPLPAGLPITRPYVRIPVVVVMASNARGFDSPKDLGKLRLAGVLSIPEKLKQLNIKTPITVIHPGRGLMGVVTGKFDAFICELSGLSHELSRHPVTGIKVVGELPASSDFAMVVSPDLAGFIPIFNKALDAIPRSHKDHIREKWFTVTFEKKWTASPWAWAVLATGIAAIALCLAGLFLLYRRFHQVKSAVEALDPHLLSVNLDKNIVITQATKALCRLTGFETGEIIGKPLMALGGPVKDSPSDMKVLWDTVQNGESWKGEIKLVKKDGSHLWTEAVVSPLKRTDEDRSGYTVIYQDISRHKHYEKLAARDELTGLFNRRHFNRIAPELLDRARKENRHLAFHLLDVDYFKRYNDAYGHPEGDRILTAIGGCLKTVFQRKDDLAFRLGGEEFGAIGLVSGPSQAMDIAEKIRRAIQNLGEPHRDNPPGVVTVSMGVWVESPGPEDRLETIYELADQALYQAKEQGRNRCVRLGAS